MCSDLSRYIGQQAICRLVLLLLAESEVRKIPMFEMSKQQHAYSQRWIIILGP